MQLKSLRSSSLSHQHGFTLAELMVTIAIIALLTALGLPSIRETFAKWQISNAINTFTSSMQLARSEAVKRGRIVRMCRSTNGTSCTSQTETQTKGWVSGWIVYADNDNSSSFNTGDDIILVESALTNFDNTTSNNSAPPPISFTPFGILQEGQGAQSINFNWDANGDFKRALCISFSGRFRITDDNTNCGSGGQG